MRRITLVTVLALGGLFATAGTAGADVGDVRFLSVNEQLFGTASEVEVNGQVRCAATIDYGLIVGVAQDEEPNFPLQTFFREGSGSAGPNASAEGVGAFGPNFDPPVGINDDSPCSQSLQSYDVLVQQSRDSGDFSDGIVQLIVMAASSAENGARGPGPFIGDLFTIIEESSFDRTR